MEIRKFVQDALSACTGATSLFMTDRQGIPILHVGDELRQRASLIASHQNTIEQINRLGMGDHRSAVFFYQNSQVVILSLGTVIAFVVSTSPEGNTGLMMELRKKLLPIVPEIEKAIPNVLIDPNTL